MSLSRNLKGTVFKISLSRISIRLVENMYELTIRVALFRGEKFYKEKFYPDQATR